MEENRFRWITAIISSLAIVIVVSYLITNSSAHDFFMHDHLSFKHSQLESNCEECHEPWVGVSDEACIHCHESKKKHFDEKNVGLNKKSDCISCHKEHQGKFNNIKLVESHLCKDCHNWGIHPEKKGAKLKTPVEGSLLINHPLHIEVGTYEGDECDLCHIQSADSGVIKLTTFDETCFMCHILEDHSADSNEVEMCPTCHMNNKFKPVVPVDPLLASAKFTHKKHQGNSCNECHANINLVTDAPGLNVPKVSKCVDCHQTKLVNEACSTCHDFHLS